MVSVPSVAAGPRPEPDFAGLAAGFEERRLRALRTTKARTLPAILGVGVASLLCLVVAVRSEVWWALGGAMLAGFAAWRWRAAPRRDYLRAVKDEAFAAAIRLIGPGWRFERKGGIDLGALKPFGILPAYDDAKQEDLMAGPWAGTRVEIVEAVLTEERGSGNLDRDVEVFKGVIVRFTLPAAPGGRILIRRRYKGAPLFSGLERVRLETSRFEKRFNVWAEDQVAARVLLTVTVMERLVALSNDLRRLGGGAPADRLEASVVEDQLLVLVPCTTNLFEARGEEEAGHVARDIERLLAEVRDVLRLAEALGVAD